MSRSGRGDHGPRCARPPVGRFGCPRAPGFSGHGPADPVKSWFADASLRSHHLPECFPAVPGAADDRQDDSALVRRRSGGVDSLPAVLPNRAAAWLRLLARHCRAAESAPAVDSALGPAGAMPAVFADRAERGLEARRLRRARVAHSRPAWRDGGAAVLPALHHRSADPGLVCSGQTGSHAVSPVCALEPRLDAGPAQLSDPD